MFKFYVIEKLFIYSKHRWQSTLYPYEIQLRIELLVVAYYVMNVLTNVRDAEVQCQGRVVLDTVVDIS